VKLLIALDVLERRPAEPALRDALCRMLSASDDDVANELWDADGGPEIVVRTAERLALPGTRPPEIVGRWGDTMLGIADVVAIYRHILDSPWREPILDALAAAPRHGADGFDQHFGIPGRLPRPWAVKQGWSARATWCCTPAAWSAPAGGLSWSCWPPSRSAPTG
jgi:hypothetical protein